MFRDWKTSSVLVGLAAAVQILGLSGCINLHEEFAATMNSLVGYRADGRVWYQFGYLGSAEEVKQLPNGNLEYVLDHTHGGDKEQCKYALEVDRSTRRFVGWRYLSKPDVCFF